ncbi:RUN and FYVE domain-containing protein 4 [Anser cygnoides]|uniref:RUN and FYVE domain-containing protein 4 n=1 Tax=Anser cygnoides TaxID=8845 RepID=UPI0034D1FC08
MDKATPIPCTSSWPRYKRRRSGARRGRGEQRAPGGTRRHPRAPHGCRDPPGLGDGAMAGDGELNRVIRDLQKTIGELNRGYREQNLPVTDGSRELHSLCAQLEFLLQFDLKEKKSFFGQRKDYWDFLCQGLARRRQEHEGVRFVTSLDKLKTPVGRGRAFLRYCLVHRQLAESLQLCLLDPESLSEWYYARSPFLSPQRRAEILGSLYELDGVTFQLALRRADLDTAWPMFSETLVRPSMAKTAPQRSDSSPGAHGCADDTSQPIAAPRRAPAQPSPPASASPRAGGEEEEEDVEGEEDMEGEEDVEGELDMEEDEKEDHDDEKEEEEEEEKEEEEDENEEEEDIPSAMEVPQPGTNGDPIPSPPPGTGLMASSPPGTEASPLVSRLRAELCRQEEAARALAARLAREKRRHRQREESSARQARLREREAEALRETNVFLSRALAETGGPQALARAQEEARRWREVAEERGTRLAEALGEAAALASRLQDCQATLEAGGRTDAPKDAGTPAEVAALEEVLRRALELAHGPQDPTMDGQGEGDPGTAADMAMRLAALATAAQEEARQSQRQLQAQREEVAQLQEQLGRARQDGERWAAALQRAQREALEREATRGAEQARQQELIRDMKGRLLELLREKDALWQKTEGIDAPAPSPAPRDAGLCARCHKDFRLLSRRYCCRLCQGKVCHACSVDVGKQGRCCLLCYQQRHPAAT